VVPFWETLTASARLAYPLIAGGVRRGLSFESIGGIVRAEGLTIANDALRSAIRLERELVLAGTRLRFLGFDTRPNPLNLPEALTALRREFSFTVEVLGHPTGGGSDVTQFITVSTDKLLTRREIEESARGAVEGNQGRYGFTVESVLLTGGIRSGAAGIL
jgi:hypothetical protein